jgi:hypothetical protein
MPENWVHKILEHEATPPELAWKNIALELDKHDQDLATGFKTKLYNYEAAAPETALKNIFNQLDNEETKIVPLKNIKKNQVAFFIKMAAAASVITIIALFYFSNKKNGEAQPETASVTPSASQPVNKTPVAKEETTLPAPDTKEKNETAAAPVKKQKTGTQNLTDYPAYIQGNAIKDLAQSPVTASTEKLPDENGNIPMDISLLNTGNTYINITGPDGQPVKVSSKLSSLLGYLNTSDINTLENLDVIIKESAKWRAIFAAWRTKMANNALAPSLTNFMDIIELSEILEEK